MTSLVSGGRGSRFKPSKIHWGAAKSVAENASGKLPDLAREFLAGGHKLMASSPSFASLHRFRLLTKRFRYTLELFRCCYGPGLERRIEALHTLQQRLGEINDCATTREILLDREDLRFAERDRLVRRLEELAVTRVDSLRLHWQEDFAPPRRERWWTDYLSRYAG